MPGGHGIVFRVADCAAFVTHYYRADRRPLQSLTDLDDEAALRALAGLTLHSRRHFGPRYLALRRETEMLARRLFVEQGGRPVRQRPHYFVLGVSPWFSGLYDEPEEIRLPLSDLPAEATSFTWVDSITALGQGVHLGVPPPNEPWQGGVHPIEQLDRARIAASPRRSASGYEGYQRRVMDQYIEVQLWHDDPVRAFIGC